MNLPTEEQIENGNVIASEIVDLGISKDMYPLGGCKKFDTSTSKFKDILDLFFEDKIDSVTAIYLAMTNENSINS